MTTAAERETSHRPTLKDLHDKSRFVKVDSRNIFDAHNEAYLEPVFDKLGNPVIDPATKQPKRQKATWKFDKKELERIAGINNARNEAGDFTPLSIGHTDPNNPNETAQPEIVGAAADYHVDWDEPHKCWMLRTNFYIRKEDYEEAKKYPYVSIELHPQDGAIHPISMLKRAPARNLGAWTFGRPMGDGVWYFSRNTRLAQNSNSQFDKSNNHYAMVLRYQMVEPNPEESIVTENPKMHEGGGEMDIELKPDDELQYARHVAKHLGAISAHPHHASMTKRYGMDAGGGAMQPPIGQPNANPSAPMQNSKEPISKPNQTGLEPTPEPRPQVSPLQHGKDKEGGVSTVSPTSSETSKQGGVTTHQLPVSGDNDQSERLRMSRDSDALRFSRLENLFSQLQADTNNRLSQLEQDKQAAVLQYQRSEAERLLQQLEYEGYELNRADEVNRMASMTPEQRQSHAAYIRQYHRHAIGMPVPSVARNEPIGAMGSDSVHPSQRNERDNRVLQFWKKKGQTAFADWDAAAAAYEAERNGVPVNRASSKTPAASTNGVVPQ